jgi:ATP-dependent helicase/nuclease subunit A
MSLDGADPIVRAATDAQRLAADPARSAWVSANAGSGKTRVLTDRVARLLLAGAPPQRILCLTYTKAAAAEMTARLSKTLGGWALADDARLAASLREVAGPDATLDAATLAEARRLFAQALETPGGLKIQTIHAFCDAVLRRFPLEAGVSPGFTVLDDAARDRLAARARERLAEAAAGGGDDAFDAAAALLGDEGLEGLCRDILSARALFAAPRGPVRLAAAFGLTPEALDEDAFDDFWPTLDREALARAADAIARGGPNDAKLADLVLALARAPDPQAAQQAAAALLTTTKGPRNFDKAPTKAVDAAHPWIKPLLTDAQARWITAKERADAIEGARRAIALDRFATAFLAAFDAEKHARAALDFDDLVARAGRLLTEGEMGAWALYKLDGGVDHILVDEAQDTAPGQWRVIRALAAEFHAGLGARDLTRTMFVVGDEKQSIYSFQGADPRLFAETRDWLEARLADAGQSLREQPLVTSFRSARAILRAVDATFAAAADGLSRDGAAPIHAAAKKRLVGRVDLWPLIPKDEGAPDPDWTEPVDAPAPQDPRIRLARLLAAEIARWLREGERLPGGGRPVRAGDVMVLVRRRDLLARELIRALKAAEVPVAGADRLRIAEELAVKDLLALARFALTPGDDLTLAALLRSPLCGMDLPTLERLAAGRAGSLWAALRAAPEQAALAERLKAAMDRADFLRPYEFFEAALIADGGRQRLIARLGPEAEDAIDELLAQALAYDADSTPTLEGFLDWIARGDVTIKREMDAAAGAVRVMTVHGAKGLEAPVVILPDCGPKRAGRSGPLVAAPLAAPLAANEPEARFAAWRAARAEAAGPVAAALALEEAAERAESRRLLYVAMTRAERWLIVCGAGDPDSETGPDSGRETWHGLVAAGLDALGDARAVAGPRDGPAAIRRLEDEGAAAEPAVAEPDTARAALPDWATRAAPPPPPRPRIAASALGGPDGHGQGEGGAGGEGEGRAAALARGTAVHALLEHLPDAPLAARPALAARLLARLAPEADAAARAAMLAQAEAAMALPEAAAAFAPDALAEVALSAELPGVGRVSGRIDRLSVTTDLVLAVDFKTDAAPPGRVADAPRGYLLQMAAYDAALRRLYPDRRVAVALLWTATPRLDVVAADVMAAMRGGGAA